MWGFVAIVRLHVALLHAVRRDLARSRSAVNLLFLVALLSLLQATLTLPGIAAIALTLGMAIDANVLINERIREELRSGNTPQAAIAAGYERAWGTILDSNVTTLIAGLALLIFGSGPVRGFAVVHCLGILTSMFSAVVVSRAIVNLVYGHRRRVAQLVDRRHRLEVRLAMEFFKIRRAIPFMRHALVFNMISLITFLAAVVLPRHQGPALLGRVHRRHADRGRATSRRADVDAIREHARQGRLQGRGAELRLLARRADPPAAGEGPVAAPTCRRRSLRLLQGAGRQAAELRRVEFVGPQVGKELAEYGALALLVIAVGIVLYLWLRFEWRFGLSAIIANLHDVVIILGFFALFQWEFSLPVLAAVLAVLGYSVNESVVVFDRVRENFRKMRKATVPEVIDSAITGVISRTIITHGCTQMMVTTMLIFGGAALHYFALALTIGICFGIYSSVLVASPLVMWLGASSASSS